MFSFYLINYEIIVAHYAIKVKKKIKKMMDHNMYQICYINSNMIEYCKIEYRELRLNLYVCIIYINMIDVFINYTNKNRNNKKTSLFEVRDY